MYSRALADSSLFALFFDTRQVSAAPGCEALPQKKWKKAGWLMLLQIRVTR